MDFESSLVAIGRQDLRDLNPTRLNLYEIWNGMSYVEQKAFAKQARIQVGMLLGCQNPYADLCRNVLNTRPEFGTGPIADYKKRKDVQLDDEPDSNGDGIHTYCVIDFAEDVYHARGNARQVLHNLAAERQRLNNGGEFELKSNILEGMRLHDEFEKMAAEGKSPVIPQISEADWDIFFEHHLFENSPEKANDPEVLRHLLVGLTQSIENLKINADRYMCAPLAAAAAQAAIPYVQARIAKLEATEGCLVLMQSPTSPAVESTPGSAS